MKRFGLIALQCAFWALALAPLSARAHADDAAPAPTGPQKIDVDALKQKYWAKGNERELEVVQNRIYTKSHKLDLQLNAGVYNADPFLSTIDYGAGLGFYFNEYIGLTALYWKMSSSQSSAYTQLLAVAQNGNGANSNNLTQLMGGELTASILYGKLSLFGKAILHFDFMLHGGAGLLSLQTTQPVNGSPITQSVIAPWGGISQQLYLTRWMSLRLDWRMMFYSQKVYEQFQPPPALGGVNATTFVAASMVTGGISFLFL